MWKAKEAKSLTTWSTRVRPCPCSPRLSTRQRGKQIPAVEQAGVKLSSHRSLYPLYWQICAECFKCTGYIFVYMKNNGKWLISRLKTRGSVLDRCRYHNVEYYTIAEATIFIQQNLYSAMHVELAYIVQSTK